MSVAISRSVDGDGHSQVSLAELLAMRARVGKVRIVPMASRAARTGQQASRLSFI